jgi:tetratricopeptide (TPR) repeat protein
VLVALAGSGSLLGAADTLGEALASGRFQDALRLADSLLKTRAKDPRLWTARALALGGLERTQDSLASFDRALRLDPAFAPALKGASETAYRRRDTRAAAYLGKLLDLEPSNETAHAMAAVLAFEARDCPRAVRHFEQSRSQATGNALAATQFGHCLLQVGRAEEAVEIFERVLAAAPANADARFNLAVAHLQARRPAAAVATLKPLGEGDPEALNLLGAAQAADGQLEAAIATLQRAAQLAPEDERNYLDLAILCQKHEAFGVAAEVLAAGLRRLPGSARLHAMRGVVHAQVGELDQAAAEFEEAGRLEPDQAYASVGLSVLLGQTGRLEGATKLLREKVTRSPNDPNLRYLLADALLREGAAPGQPEFVEAREALQHAIRVRPDFARARAGLGKVYLLEGNTARAVEELEHALRREPDNRPALSQLLTALRRLGREQEAAAVAERLRRQYERDLEAGATGQRLRITQPVPDSR